MAVISSDDLSLNVRDFGARGDGVTDDFAAFHRAQTAASDMGAAIHLDYGRYIIGDSLAIGTAIETVSGAVWDLDDATLAQRAKTTSGVNQRRLFSVEDDDAVSISGGRIDGEDKTTVGIGLSGVITDLVISDTHFVDARNFAIVYGDRRTDPNDARFESISISGVTVSGSVGPTGDGAGLNFFARSQNGDTPASFGLNIEDVLIDVRGRGDIGPQAIKINNARDVRIADSELLGGDVAGLTLSNGTQDALVENVHIRNAEIGININSLNNTSTTRTSDVTVRDVTIDNATSFGRYGIWIAGSPEDVTIEDVVSDRTTALISSGQNLVLEYTGDGDFAVGDIVMGQTSGATGRIVGLSGETLVLVADGVFQSGERIGTGTATITSLSDDNLLVGVTFRNIIQTGGDFLVSDNDIAGGAVTDLLVSGLTLTGEEGGGRFRLGRGDRTTSESIFADVSLISPETRVYAIDNRGDGNLFLSLSTEGLNRDGSAVPLIRNFGTESVVDTLFLASDANLSELVDNRAGTAPTVQTVVSGGRQVVTINGTSNGDVLSGREMAETMIGLGGDDILSAGEGADTLQGRQGDDVLDGGAGHDRLSGGSGHDRLIGGVGNDTYVLTDDRDEIVEEIGGGTDTVISLVSLTNLSALAEVEVIELRGSAVSAIGNGFDSVFRVTSSLSGANGLNLFDGGGGRDTIDYSAIEGDLTIALDSANGEATGAEIGVDRLIRIDNAIGGAGDDNVRGSVADNVITLRDGNDDANGRQGNDVVEGGDGDDRMLGGVGDDHLFGGSGNDELLGGPGDDRLLGGDGDDIYKIDDLGDRIVETTEGGHDIARASISGIRLADWVEELHLIGRAISGEGNGRANTLIGADLDEVLDGNGGDDVIVGAAGDDLLTGGGGSDRFVFDLAHGADTITDFSAGTGLGDRLDFSATGLARTDAMVSQDAADTLVTLPDGSLVRLVGVNAADLAPDDLLFDEAPRLWLDAFGSERTEGATIVARLDRPLDTALDVTLNISNIDPAAPAVSATTLTLSFAAGQAEAVVDVAVVDDVVIAEDRGFLVTATAATGAIDLAYAMAVGNVQDDDRWRDVDVTATALDVVSGQRPVDLSSDGTLLLALQGEDRTVSFGFQDTAGAISPVALPNGWTNAYGAVLGADGSVAGYAFNTGETAKAPFVWRPDSASNPGYEFLPLDDVSAPIITGMSNDGTVIGYDVDGALWHDGASTALDGQARDISADGVVVGVNGDSEPFVRAADGSVTLLPLSRDADAGGATAISADGSFVAGICASDAFHWSRGFWWNAESGVSLIGTEHEYFDPVGILGDDAIIGRYRHFTGYDEYSQAVFENDFAVFSQQRGLTPLDDLLPITVSEVVDVNADGTALAFSQEIREWYVLTFDDMAL